MGINVKFTVEDVIYRELQVLPLEFEIKSLNSIDSLITFYTNKL